MAGRGVVMSFALLLLTACGASSSPDVAPRPSSALRASLLPAPVLGAAGAYSVLGGQTVTNTGPTTVDGNVGVYPGSAVTGLADITFSGTGHAAHQGDAEAQQAQADLTIAYLAFQGETCTLDLTGQDLGGMTLTQGVYCFSSSAGLTGTVTLDAHGDPGATFIFRIGSSLTTASSSSVFLANGARDCNVFWVVGSSATLGTDSAFRGTILALTSITLDHGATLDGGRALARNGSVTTDTNVLFAPSCEALFADTQTTLAGCVSTPIFGTPILLTATITSTGGAPTGDVTFFDGATAIGGPVALSAGAATLSTSALAAGTHSIAAQYAGTVGFNASTSTPCLMSVLPAGAVFTATTTTVNVSPSPGCCLEEITITANVWPVTGGGTPAGFVVFQDGQTMLGQATLVGGSASITIATLPAGSYSIGASYSGDVDHTPSTSQAFSLDVAPKDTYTGLSVSPAQATLGQAVLLDATTSASCGSARGKVTFYDGGSVIGWTALTGGTAALTTSTLSTGWHSLTASYSGEDWPSNSTPVNVEVTAPVGP